ncbi:hypothetical protein [Thermomonas sp. HDW16]|uniref:hypothetical protein n=1 Tax=Thermomonas sp. HDW16 TaxID=2714945 RepID=UPI00140C037B|nr:hypothetical protein [Thermomonas sp. HDW16]QIL21065.1 hypothetical protein G7079_10185 [Thermomonas sp. HDW16]
MKDKFADLEEPRKRTLPTAIAVLVAITALFAYRLSHTKPIELSGLVESVAAGHVARVHLDNGLTINAKVSSSRDPSSGQRVTVLETVSLLSTPAYVVQEEAPSQ